MKQKKTMMLWQMIVIAVLLVGMMVTMFLPAFHINGNALVKMYNKLAVSEIASLMGLDGDMDMDEVREDTDESVSEMEEEYGVSISYISPGSIMIGSDLLSADEDALSDMGLLYESSSGEETNPFSSLHTLMKVMFWIVYIVGVLVLVLTILGFALKITKLIPLITSAVYGLAVAICFAVFQFWIPHMFADTLMDLMSDSGSDVLSSMGIVTDSLASIFAKVISCFWGIAFLVAFIVGILILLMSLVSLFVGGGAAQPSADMMPDTPPYDPYEEERRRMAIQERERQESERQERERQQREEAERIRRMQTMGRVMCIKGVSAGQGFSLPEDRKVVVGKSAQNANLVISNPHVSNVHCSIRYRAAANSYVVNDHSSNGTFVNGVRMQKDVPMEFPAGTVLQLADGTNEIKLG